VPVLAYRRRRKKKIRVVKNTKCLLLLVSCTETVKMFLKAVNSSPSWHFVNRIC